MDVQYRETNRPKSQKLASLIHDRSIIPTNLIFQGLIYFRRPILLDSQRLKRNPEETICWTPVCRNFTPPLLLKAITRGWIPLRPQRMIIRIHQVAKLVFTGHFSLRFRRSSRIRWLPSTRRENFTYQHLRTAQMNHRKVVAWDPCSWQRAATSNRNLKTRWQFIQWKGTVRLNQTNQKLFKTELYL